MSQRQLSRRTQRRQAWTCQRKRPYPSYQDAYHALIQRFRENDADPGTRVYACSACGQWHHGHVGGERTKSLERLYREGEQAR